MPISNPIRIEFQPKFDENTDEFVLRVSDEHIQNLGDGYSEVRLPIYLTRTYLAPGGSVLRPLVSKYRAWLLEQQGGTCAICGSDETDGHWNLDHQPPVADLGSKYIDYEKVTDNRVIHSTCDSAQLPT